MHHFYFIEIIIIIFINFHQLFHVHLAVLVSLRVFKSLSEDFQILSQILHYNSAFHFFQISSLY